MRDRQPDRIPEFEERPTALRTVRQVFFRWLKLAVVAYLVVVLVFLLLERSLVYFPERYPYGDWEPAGLAFEDAEFQAADGTRLHGWFVPHEDPQAVILMAHGNGGNLTAWTDDLRQIHDVVGAAVMIFDYRGYGRREGAPDERGILQDARAARKWLAMRTNVSESDVVLLGTSLGGGVMVDLAAADGARGLVLQNTFTSLPDVAAFHFPWLPARWFMRNRLTSIDKIADYRGPLLQSHGDADTIVPYELGQRLFERANDPKQFLTLEGFDHNGLPPPVYFDALAEFIAQLPATASQ